jgi:hypothetical protein
MMSLSPSPSQAPQLINVSLLTSVTIDSCALKQGLNFSSSSLFRALSANLAPTVLRLGGSDGNTYHPDMRSDLPVEVCACGKPCNLTRTYWDSIRAFAADVGFQLIFGLAQDLGNAVELVQHTAADEAAGGPAVVYAYAWGNELTGNESFVLANLRDLTAMRALLLAIYNGSSSSSSSSSSSRLRRPLLVAPDLPLVRRGTVPANVSQDEGINDHLKYMDNFTAACGAQLDAVTWHTYDYRTSE